MSSSSSDEEHYASRFTIRRIPRRGSTNTSSSIEELRPGPRADERANRSSSDEEEQVLEEEEAGASAPLVRHAEQVWHAERNAGCDDINHPANQPAKRHR